MKRLSDKKLFLPIKVVISVGLMAFIFMKIDLAGLHKHFATLNFWWLGLMILLPHFGILVSSIKWQWLLNVLDINEKLGSLFRFYFIGTFFNNFLPGVYGGDFYRILKLAGERDNDLSSVTAATFAERLIGMAGLITFVCLILFYQRVHDVLPSITVLAFFVSAGYLVVCILVFQRKPIKAVYDLDRYRPVRYIADFLRNSHSKLVLLRIEKKPLIISYLLSILFYFLAVLTRYSAAKSLGIYIEFKTVMIVVTLVLLVGLLPVTINGLGLNEASYVFFFSLFGMDVSVAFSIALLLRSRILLTGILGGLIFILYDKLNILKTKPSRSMSIG
jgi:uncharacterized protein (TIRG00374 family)